MNPMQESNNVGTQTNFDEDSVCTSVGTEGTMETSETSLNESPLNHDVLVELESEILKEIDEYVQYNLLGYSSPTFHEDLIDYVLDSVYDAAVQCNIMEESETNYQHLHEIVSMMSDDYFHTMNIHILRSYTPNTLSPIQDLDKIRKQIAHLKSLPQPPQRTPEWYAHRHNLITASNIYKALGSDALYNSLVCEKCKPLVQGQGMTTTVPEYVNTQSSLHWGNKYEQVSVMIYETMFPGTAVDSAFGCIVHPQYPFLGASPDGIAIAGPREGHMVEIKNRVSKDITGIPSLAYWVQTQVQMEVCELEYCDLFETSFKEFMSETAFYENTEMHEYRGVILYLVSKTDTGIPRYEYMPPLKTPPENETEDEKITVDSWIHQRIYEAGNEFILVEVQYWYLNEVSCVIIPRNRAWFQEALPRFQEIWATIERERVSGYEHRLPKKRTAMQASLPGTQILDGTLTVTVRKLGSDGLPISNILSGLLASVLEEYEKPKV